tara:strand:- start:3766 stop:4254 length:489 start_codon:yes stop_codon:yes gene_type:complete
MAATETPLEILPLSNAALDLVIEDGDGDGGFVDCTKTLNHIHAQSKPAPLIYPRGTQSVITIGNHGSFVNLFRHHVHISAGYSSWTLHVRGQHNGVGTAEVRLEYNDGGATTVGTVTLASSWSVQQITGTIPTGDVDLIIQVKNSHAHQADVSHLYLVADDI